MKVKTFNLSSATINGKRITLKPLTLKDGKSLFSLINRSRKELGKWLPWVGGTKEVIHTEEFIKRTSKERRSGESLNLGIFLKNPETIIGTIGVRNLKTGIGEIGYWLGTEFTGKGYIIESTTLLSDFILKNIPIHKIEIRCEPKNLKSRAIPKRLGFKKEGLLRKVVCGNKPGIYRDLVVYGILNSEWKPTATA